MLAVLVEKGFGRRERASGNTRPSEMDHDRSEREREREREGERERTRMIKKDGRMEGRKVVTEKKVATIGLLSCWKGDGVGLVASRRPPVPREPRPSFHVRRSSPERAPHQR